MPTRLYRFHCTDGYDLIVDRRGKRMPTPALVRRHAERVALDLMRLADRIDWSAWQVEVYDATGRSVWMRTFTDLRDARPKV